MGNCQAADMAAAVVEVPWGRADNVAELQAGGAMYAQHLMSAYPGYFVALFSSSAMLHPAAPPPRSSVPTTAATPCIIVSPRADGGKSSIPGPRPHFRLLAADAPLCSGHRYRLLSFEEVLTSFSQQGKDNNGAFVLSNTSNCDRPAIATKKNFSNHSLARPTHAFNDRAVNIGC